MSNLQLTLDMSQRWLFGKPRYRPPRETIQTAEYDVCEIPDDRTAGEFVRLHHYSGSMGAARVRVGLYRRGRLVGVAVFSHPCSDAVLTRTFPVPARNAVELGRFVLLDEVPANGESFFLARGFEIVRTHGIVGVVTFSDPVPRRAISGDLILPGHCGIAFQAHNGVYLGHGTPRTLRLLPNGRVLHERTIQKIRKGERGWKAAAAQLEPFGASVPPEDRAERMEWLSGKHAPTYPSNSSFGQPQICMAADIQHAPRSSGQFAVSEAPRQTSAVISEECQTYTRSLLSRT